jgi:hypothetical protein
MFSGIFAPFCKKHEKKIYNMPRLRPPFPKNIKLRNRYGNILLGRYIGGILRKMLTSKGMLPALFCDATRHRVMQERVPLVY